MIKPTEEEYKTYCSEFVPKGVWIFWGLVGAVVIGWLATRYATIKNASTVAINLGASVGALLAAIATFKTVREMQAVRKEERAYRRPRFVFTRGVIGVTTDGEHSNYLTIVCTQVGPTPAATVTATGEVTYEGPYGDAIMKVGFVRPSNPISQNSELHYKLAGTLIMDSSETHRVDLTIRYFDEFYGTSFEQPLSFRWDGLEPDAISAPLYPIDRSQMRHNPKH